METRRTRASRARDDDESSLPSVSRPREVEIQIREEDNEREMDERAPPAVDPMYEQFRQFQLFQAFMAANPMPAMPMVPMPVQAQRNMLPADPGSMVAMAQVKPPMLEGLSIAQIKQFRTAYRRYAARCVVHQWRQSPGSLVNPEHLLVIASRNGIMDVEEVRELPEDVFFSRLCAIHNAASTREWHSIVTQVKMSGSTCSLEKFIDYSEEFKFQVELAGQEFAPPMKELVKCFVNGISPKTLQSEIRLRYIETLTEAIEEGVQIVVKYRHMWETQEKEESKEKKSSKHAKAAIADKSVTTSGNRTQERSSSTSDASAKPSIPTCYKCLQKGHTVKSCPNPKHPSSTWVEKKARAMKASTAPVESVEEPVVRSVRVFMTDQGYEPSDDTWEPYHNVQDLAALDLYLKTHPEVKLD